MKFNCEGTYIPNGAQIMKTRWPFYAMTKSIARLFIFLLISIAFLYLLTQILGIILAIIVSVTIGMLIPIIILWRDLFGLDDMENYGDGDEIDFLHTEVFQNDTQAKSY
jgi:hypothetical protein